jgi:hypothetical protein
MLPKQRQVRSDIDPKSVVLQLDKVYATTRQETCGQRATNSQANYLHHVSESHSRPRNEREVVESDRESLATA